MSQLKEGPEFPGFPLGGIYGFDMCDRVDFKSLRSVRIRYDPVFVARMFQQKRVGLVLKKILVYYSNPTLK